MEVSRYSECDNPAMVVRHAVDSYPERKGHDDRDGERAGQEERADGWDVLVAALP
jgi:hypothetical protein